MAYREDVGSLAKARRLDNGRLIVDALITRSGVFEYLNPDGSVRREYRPPDEVFHKASMDSLVMVPFTDLHPPVLVTAANARTYAVGQVGEQVRRDGIHLAGAIAVNDAATIAKMDGGECELSAGYECDYDPTPGVTPLGERYDGKQMNIRYNHVARVPAGRAGTARARMDALRVARADSAIQVTPHSVALTECDPAGVTAWVTSYDSTSADLLAKVSAALAASPGIAVTAGEEGELVRLDSLHRVGRADTGVRICTASAVTVRVSSRTMTPDQLNNLLSAALSASGDLTVRTDSNEENHMNLEQALAALAAANEKIGAEKQRADAAEKKADKAKAERKDAEDKLATTERKLAEAEAAAATEKKRADEAEKTRADAADDFNKRVSARAELIAAATRALARNDKGETLSADGKRTIKLDSMDDRAIRVEVVAKLDGVTIPAERSDDAVAYAFELATARSDKADKAVAGARETIERGRADAAQTPARVEDPEVAARKRMDERRATRWKTPNNNTARGAEQE